MNAKPPVPSSGRRIRVLHAVMSMECGGMERLIADLIRNTNEARFELHLLVFKPGGRFAVGLESHATLHHAVALPKWTMLWPQRLASQVAAIAPNVIHSHSGVWWKSAFAARLARVPKIVHTEHGWMRSDSRVLALALKRLCARLSTDIVVVSSDLGAFFDRWIVDRPGKVRVVVNGVDTDHFSPRQDDGELRRELAIAPNTPVILSVARLEAVKAHDVMLRALAHLRVGSGPGAAAVLLLVGDGAERIRMQQLAQDLGIGKSVYFAGWRDDVGAAHAMASIFTLTSESEGTSIALLEAMSSGLCPVVTDVGGNGAVLGSTLAHRLVPAGEPTEIASAWAEALRDDDQRRRDAEAARARVKETFNIAATARQYERIYTSECS